MLTDNESNLFEKYFIERIDGKSLWNINHEENKSSCGTLMNLKKKGFVKTTRLNKKIVVIF